MVQSAMQWKVPEKLIFHSGSICECIAHPKTVGVAAGLKEHLDAGARWKPCSLGEVTTYKKGGCKVLTLHGLLTCHVAHARARYRCRTAIHIASTLEVQYKHIRGWSLDSYQT